MSNSYSISKRKRMLAVAMAIGLPIGLAGQIYANGPGSPDTRVRAPATASPGARFDRFIVKYRDGSDEKANASALQRSLGIAAAQAGVRNLQATNLRELAIGANVIRTSKKLDRAEAESLMRQLRANPAVEYVELDAMMRPTFTPNDTRYPEQWNYFEYKGGANLPLAWDRYTGSGIVIAVLDTGITDHSELNANVIPGYDFISDTFVSRDGDGRDADPSDPGDWNPVADECYSGSPVRNSSWHGTHVSGTAAAVTNNAAGVAGVAFDAKIQPVRVLGRCGGLLSDISDAIVWASGGHVTGVPDNTTPAEVINMSLGGAGACGTTYQTAIDSAVSRGTVIVTSAGNSNADAAGARPANCNNVIAVGATTRSGGKSSFSNYGATVDISAPGSSILSTLNTGTTTPGTESYAFYNGTSMASPHVAGVVALMQSAAVRTPAEVEANLKLSARPLQIPCSVGCGAGIVDANAAISAQLGEELPPYPEPPPVKKKPTTSIKCELKYGSDYIYHPECVH